MRRKIIVGIMLILLLMGILTSTFNVQQAESSEPPLTEWNKTYGGAGAEVARSVVETSDGGYALAGETYSFGADAGDFWLVKVAGPLAMPVHNIDTGLRYATIQEAINASETLSGHTILVGEGTYYEHVTVHKSLSLIGADKFNTIIDGNLTGNVMTITVHNVNITDFTIRNSGPNPNTGIYVSSSGNNIGRNIFINNYYNIKLDYSSNNTISENNIIANNNFAIWLSYSSNNSISRNNITNSNWGGYFYQSSFNILAENNITNNNDAVRFMKSYNNTVSGNAIRNNTVGIWLDFSYDHTLCGNTIINNTRGVSLSLFASAHIYHNNFINNTEQPRAQGAMNVWDNDYPSGGNYWNDYNGTDLFSGTYQNETDSDGLGDTPYTINADNIDEYPLMGPFGPLTPKGENVTVMPAEEVRIIYEKVLEPGLTLAEEKKAPDKAAKKIAEKKYKFAEKEECLEIETTAEIAEESEIKIIKRYKPEALEEAVAPEELRLMRWEEATEEWEDVTKRVDTIAEMVIAETVERSIFALVVPIHDINVTEVTLSKNIVGQGFIMSINAIFMNEGGCSDTFNVTAYANTTIIKTLTNITLTSENSTTVTFTWNTTGVAKGNYTITAKATPLPYETDALDNTYTDGYVIVAMEGDLSGPKGVPDGLVDIDDVVFVAVRFGSYLGHNWWDPNADLTGPEGVPDGIVDIDDVTVPAIHFGEIDP